MCLQVKVIPMLKLHAMKTCGPMLKYHPMKMYVIYTGITSTVD